MTISDQTPLRLLPMADHVRGKRSAVTCRLKCADACLGPECNTSDNAHFRDIASAALTRRSLLGLGLAGAVGLVVGNAVGGGSGAAYAAKPGTAGLAFGAIDPVDRLVDEFTVPAGYRWSPIIRWGDPLFASSPSLDFANQSADAQAGQFGYNNDYLDIIADPSGKTGVLVANHEYVNPNIMFPPTNDPAEKRRRGDIYKAAQGMSVVELRRDKAGRTWWAAGATAASRSRPCSS